jgi:hypothetical protein
MRNALVLMLVGSSFWLACSSGSSGENGAPSSDGGLPDVNKADAGASDGAASEGGPMPRSCVPPSNVPDPLVISGLIKNGAGSPAPGATVELHANADESLLASTTTATNGTFTLPGVATGGHPLQAHAHITKAGSTTTIFYVVDGLRSPLIGTFVASPQSGDANAMMAGVTWNHANGIVAVSVHQCNDGLATGGLPGAVVTVVPGSTTDYDDGNGNPVPSGTATKAPSGYAFDFNVPPGKAEVHLLYQGALTTYPVEVLAGTFTYLMDFP